MPCICPTAEAHTHVSSMVFMGAMAGGVAMLLIVVVILIVYKRLEALYFFSPHWVATNIYKIFIKASLTLFTL